MRILFATALVLFATAAGAQNLNSANYRMEGCRAAVDNRATYFSGYCLGLVDGIVYGETGRDTFCLPSDAEVTLGQWFVSSSLTLMRAPLGCTRDFDCFRSKPW